METGSSKVVCCSKLVPFPLAKIARSFQKQIGFDLLYFYKGLGGKIFAKSDLERLFVMFCEGKTTKEKCQFSLFYQRLRAYSLPLKQRLKATRRWPIGLFLSSMINKTKKNPV